MYSQRFQKTFNEFLRSNKCDGLGYSFNRPFGLIKTRAKHLNDYLKNRELFEIMVALKIIFTLFSEFIALQCFTCYGMFSIRYSRLDIEQSFGPGSFTTGSWNTSPVLTGYFKVLCKLDSKMHALMALKEQTLLIAMMGRALTRLFMNFFRKSS